ncbi:MAG: ISAs1 family transposase [Caldilineaceae bacterium]
MDSTIEWQVVPHQPDVEVSGEQLRSFYQVLCSVPDNRKPRGKRYEAGLVLTLLLLAKMAGEQTMVGIADWVRLRQKQLCTTLSLTCAPCANTYRYICEQVDAQVLNQRLAALFTQANTPGQTTRQAQTAEAQTAEAQTGEAQTEQAPTPRQAGPLRHLACDGKTLRGSHRLTASGCQQAQAVLGIYDPCGGQMVAMLPIEGKGYEQKAFKQWLKVHASPRQGATKQSTAKLAGSLLTADALHTQSGVSKAIRRTGADYLLIVKKNQRQLHADIEYLFSQQPDFWFPEGHSRQVGSGHGRTEVRTIRVSSELNDYLADRWPGVQQVFRLQRSVTRRSRQGEKVTHEVVYGLTSLSSAQADPEQLLTWVRAHWQIENRNHWRRDVTLGEDRMQLASKPAALVIAVLNCALLALFDRLHVTNVPSAIRACAADPAHALSLLTSTL